MNQPFMTQTASDLVRHAIESDGVIRNALARGIVNTRALARNIELQASGSASFDAILSAIRRYPIDDISKNRSTTGKGISKLSLRNGITVISLKNSRELMNSILKFSGEINPGSGEVFRLVTNMDSASVTIDAKNLERFESFISGSQITRKLENLAEIVIEMAIEIETTEGVLSAIVTELAMNDVVIRQFTTIGPGRMIFLVNESDATKAYNALDSLNKA